LEGFKLPKGNSLVAYCNSGDNEEMTKYFEDLKIFTKEQN
jgi:hypothetical protein